MSPNKTNIKKINYETCPKKHYARTNGWLQDCNWQNARVKQNLQKGLRKQAFTYFTFCASQAVDVYMLEKYELLNRDDRGRLNTVYFCEYEPNEFEKINSQIRSDKAGFNGEFEKIVLFKDDRDTLGKDDFTDEDDKTDKKLRDKFRIKKLHKRFKGLFPIDVINLDVYGVFFPTKKDKYRELLTSIDKIFDFQKNTHPDFEHSIDSFVLILNTHLEFSQYNKEIIQELVKISTNNVNDYTNYRNAFLSKFDKEPCKEIAEEYFSIFFPITLPKVIFEMASRKNWVASKHSIYIYERTTPNGKKYHFMSSSIRYKKVENTGLPHPNQNPYSTEYENEMLRILKDCPLDIDKHFANYPHEFEESTNNLNEIINYKQEILHKFEIQL